MKYIVITAKHHDCFSMFGSKVTGNTARKFRITLTGEKGGLGLSEFRLFRQD